MLTFSLSSHFSTDRCAVHNCSWNITETTEGVYVEAKQNEFPFGLNSRIDARWLPDPSLDREPIERRDAILHTSELPRFRCAVFGWCTCKHKRCRLRTAWRKTMGDGFGANRRSGAVTSQLSRDLVVLSSTGEPTTSTSAPGARTLWCRWWGPSWTSVRPYWTRAPPSRIYRNRRVWRAGGAEGRLQTALDFG